MYNPLLAVLATALFVGLILAWIRIGQLSARLSHLIEGVTIEQRISANDARYVQRQLDGARDHVNALRRRASNLQERVETLEASEQARKDRMKKVRQGVKADAEPVLTVEADAPATPSNLVLQKVN